MSGNGKAKSVRGGDIITQYLIKEEVPYVIGLCGHGNIGLLDSLYTYRDKIKTIAVRHEQSAGHMADAYYRVAHKPVATLTSCGPGSANMPVAIASALMDSSAFLSITGNVPTSQFNRSPFQETGRYYQGDFPSVIRSYVKKSFQPTRAEMLPLAMQQSFNYMLNGRPGPVNIDVPLNVFLEEAEVEIPEPGLWRKGITSRSGGDSEEIDKIVQLLVEAKRPAILAGHGVILSEAAPELNEVVERLKIPVIFTPNGMGSLPYSHFLALGPIGRNGTYAANQAAREADVLLALGTRFCDRVSSAWISGFTFNIPPTRVIQIDIDAQEIGRNYPVEIGIIGDVKTVLKQIIEDLDDYKISNDNVEWINQVGNWKEKWEKHILTLKQSDTTPIHPARLVNDLHATIPSDAVVLADVGVHHNWLVQFWAVEKPQTLLQSWGFASMGFGVSGVLGAKLAAPDKHCIAICGDGGFLMTPHILSTAVEFNLPAIWVVWNNYGMCAIRDLQLGGFGDRELATSFYHGKTGELYNPDFVALANSFGVSAEKVEHPDQIKPAMEKALAADEPYLIEVVVDRDIRPLPTGGWRLPPLPSVKPNFSL